MKRITWWPQAWLGLVFSWGALGRLAGGHRRSLDLPALLLWFGSIAWVIGYDTLYAIQDIEDDALGRREVLGAAAGRQGSARRRDLLRGRRPALGCGASGRSGRTGWRCSRLHPPRSTSPTRRFGPTRRTASARSACSGRTAPPACWFSSPCWSSASPAARRSPCFQSKRPARARRRSSSSARIAGADAADAVYVGSESQSVQVRLGELEHVDRSEGEEMGLRVFVGQRSASVASSDFSREALRELVAPGDGDGSRGSGRPLCRPRSCRAARNGRLP